MVEVTTYKVAPSALKATATASYTPPISKLGYTPESLCGSCMRVGGALISAARKEVYCYGPERGKRGIGRQICRMFRVRNQVIGTVGVQRNINIHSI